MPDRLFLRSLVATAGIAAVLFAGLFLFFRRTGWAGFLAVSAALCAFLGWFYFGPRPDLRRPGDRTPGDSGDGGE